MAEDRKYAIIETSEVENVNFNQILEDAPRTLRFSQDGHYTFVKFEGDTPSFLDGKTQYTHADFLVILRNTSGIWYIDDEEVLTLQETVANFINTITWNKYNPFN
tara:strand:+ start:466 stop:780 length:315 start_codon:yes stop_codon:yes gene_type:complete